MPESVYRLADQAVADLNEIADYLGARSPTAATNVLEALLETFELLATNPGLGTARDDLHNNIRIFVASAPADSYVICYYAFSEGVEISDVIHAARDWIGIFARDER
jgi:plasmid stabilization system protein ParE